MNQLSHYHTNFQEKKFPVILILDGITSPANVGSLFRLADAFNIEKIILCGPEVNLNSNRLLRTARSTIEKVKFEQQEETVDSCKEYTEKGYTIIALEITKDSKPLHQLSLVNQSKLALVVGNERIGISPDVLDLSHHKIHINMFGNNSSMNVAQATGIALYEITKSLLNI